MTEPIIPEPNTATFMATLMRSGALTVGGTDLPSGSGPSLLAYRYPLKWLEPVAQPMDLHKSLEERVSNYAFKDYVAISMSDTISSVATAMQRTGSGEALVVQNGVPIGIVTERDILYKVVAAGRDPSKIRAEQVMSAPVQEIDGDSSVADAIAKMSRLHIRRLVVTKGKKVVGLITQRRIVAEDGRVQVVLPELVIPTGFACPYCGAVVQEEEQLSKHIDQLHVGGGLLTGDRRKW